MITQKAQKPLLVIRHPNALGKEVLKVPSSLGESMGEEPQSLSLSLFDESERIVDVRVSVDVVAFAMNHLVLDGH